MRYYVVLIASKSWSVTLDYFKKTDNCSFSHSDRVYVLKFHPSVLNVKFLCPFKTSENITLSHIDRGYENKTFDNKVKNMLNLHLPLSGKWK